jgi:hypothetical protein
VPPSHCALTATLCALQVTTRCTVAKCDALHVPNGTTGGYDIFDDAVVLFCAVDEMTRPFAKIFKMEAGLKWTTYVDTAVEPNLIYKSWCVRAGAWGMGLDEVAAWLMEWLVENLAWSPTLEDWCTANVHNAGGAGLAAGAE